MQRAREVNEQICAPARSIDVKTRRFVGLGVAALALGAAVLVYRGPGRAIVRGHLGDVAATMLVYAVLGLIAARVARLDRMAARALATFAIASAIELGQTWWHARSLAGELVAGNTFDPVDFVAYALGVVVGLAVERSGRGTMRP